MPPNLEELIAQLKKKYPHLSDYALKLLAEQRIKYEDLKGAEAGWFDPAAKDNEPTIGLDPNEDIVATFMHEGGHAFDFTETDEAGFPQTSDPNVAQGLLSAFDIAKSAYESDQRLLGHAQLPQEGLPTPKYLQPTSKVGPVSGEENISTAQYIQELANVPEGQWGQPIEAFAETLLTSQGEWGAMPPSVLPFLAEMGRPASEVSQERIAKANTYAEQVQQQPKLPPIPKTSQQVLLDKYAGRSTNRASTKIQRRVAPRTSKPKSRKKTYRKKKSLFPFLSVSKRVGSGFRK